MRTANTALESGDVAKSIVRSARWTLRFSERKLLLGAVDSFLMNLALAATIILRLDPSIPFLLNHWSWFISLTMIWFMFALLFECYNLDYAASIRRSVKRISAAVVMTAAVYILVPYVTPSLPESRLNLVVFPTLSLASLATWRLFYAKVFVRPGFQQRALIVGTAGSEYILSKNGKEFSIAKGKFYNNIGYRILGLVVTDAEQSSATLENIPVLGTGHDLVRIARQLCPDELVIPDQLLSAIASSATVPGQPQRRGSDAIHNDLFAAILECSELGISVTTTAVFYERTTGRIPVEHIGRALHIALRLNQTATNRFYMAFRRTFDIYAGLIGCTVLVIVIPFVWLANRFQSPGPLFYRQERVGKGGQTFWLIKFRSMVVDAEKYVGIVWAAEDDPRITPVGRLLRKTRLDEFPQFWNMLKGEMSLIGPRPERPYFVNQLSQQFPFYRIRHAVKPGLTGWAQVKYRYGASVQDALKKLQYDLYYIKHQSLLIDLEILLRTVTVVLGLKGR